MTSRYDHSGVRFLYPENWTISDEQFDEIPQSVTVQSTGSAFWSVHIYPASFRPTDLTAEALAAMSKEYDNLESSQCVEWIGENQATGYDLEFYCLDFVVTAKTLALTISDRTYLLVYQSESREYDKLGQVFIAISTSLLQNAAP